MRTGGTTPVFIVGSDMRTDGLHPWNLVAGSLDALSIPGAVAVDRPYFERLGVERASATPPRSATRRSRSTAVTSGIRSFTTTPYVFTHARPRRAPISASSPNKATYFLVHLAPGSRCREPFAAGSSATLTDAEVLTPDEFRSRSRSFWLFGTGAGAALFAGALLGMIVGTVIVAQTLYSSTKDHINEFATLRAIGSSGTYIHKVIICPGAAERRHRIRHRRRHRLGHRQGDRRIRRCRS